MPERHEKQKCNKQSRDEYTMLNSMELSNTELSGIKCVERFKVLIGSRLTNRMSD